MLNTYIPFEGFYCSNFSSALDSCMESDIQWLNEQYGWELELHGKIDIYEGDVDYEKICKAYVWFFKEWLNDKIDVYPESMKFETLISPKYYNFSSDRLYVDISYEDMKAIYDAVDKEKFRDWLIEAMRPRDGFIPHFSNVLSTYPEDLKEWHSAQLSLIFAYIRCVHENKYMSLASEFLDCNGFEVLSNSRVMKSYQELKEEIDFWKDE